MYFVEKVYSVVLDSESRCRKKALPE